MSNQEELEKEYFLFKIKIAKINKAFYDAINELSPENLERFKQEMKCNLPQGLIQLMKDLNN
ncbi:MAG: hypothetical protein IJX00_02030 [Clostridia bacterium]|nr:hypothetical protein [Clostridia bacterium]